MDLLKRILSGVPIFNSSPAPTMASSGSGTTDIEYHFDDSPIILPKCELCNLRDATFICRWKLYKERGRHTYDEIFCSDCILLDHEGAEDDDHFNEPLVINKIIRKA